MNQAQPKKRPRRTSSRRCRSASAGEMRLENDLKKSREELVEQNKSLLQSQLELELSRERYADLYDAAPVSFITLDRAGLIVEINLPAERLLGRSRNHMKGCPFINFVAKGDRKKFLSHLSRCRKSWEQATPLSVELELALKGRETPVFIELICVPSAGQFQELVIYKCIFFDITARKNYESELRRARDDAERASRAKDDFLATLSHELRTPLNPVLLLASDAVKDHDLPPRVRANFDLIRRNIELESRLIDDLLDLTRIARGKLSFEKRLVHATQILRETIATLRLDIDQKQLTLKENFAASYDVVLGDAVRLQQVFGNILRNAIKFTPNHGIIQIETANDAQNRLAVAISDTGIGMTKHEISNVFEAFAQGDHSVGRHSHSFGGLGIGLAICRRLVEFHSGTVEAASNGRDMGTTFTVKLPVAERTAETAGKQPAPTKSAAAAGTTPSGVRILLVEDHEATRNALTVLLLNRHHKVHTAGSIKEARDALSEGKFDLLISDIGLPDGNGNDLMHELKPQHLPGIALTGYGMDEDIERSYEAGFVAHLTKPIRIDSLEAALASAVRSFAC